MERCLSSDEDDSQATTIKPPPTASDCKGRTGFILDPNSKCKNYYTCSKQNDQIVISQKSTPCSFGVFDENTSQCVLTGCPGDCDPKDCEHNFKPDCGIRDYPFQNKEDCTAFTDCVDQKEEVIPCPSNQYAQLSDGICVDYDNIDPPDCINNPEEFVCTSVGYVINPDDCRAYYRCFYDRFQNKLLVVDSGTCPNGYYFNKQKKICISCSSNTDSDYCYYCP